MEGDALLEGDDLLEGDALFPEPASIALSIFPSSKCSVWDCNRRRSQQEAYCCRIHDLLAEEDSFAKTPIIIFANTAIQIVQNEICTPLLSSLAEGINPGVPDISDNLLLKHPWQQPDVFGLNFFPRERCRWWMFINPYEIGDGINIWKLTDYVVDGNIDRSMFKPICGDSEQSSAWRVYRFSVVVGGEVNKGLFLMVYKPKKVSRLTELNQKLCSVLTEQNAKLLTPQSFDKNVFAFFFKPKCSKCENFSQTYRQVSTLFQKYNSLVIASVDLSEETQLVQHVEKHPTVMYFEEGMENVLKDVWLWDIEDFIGFLKLKGLKRDVDEVQGREARLVPSSECQHPEPAQIAVAEFLTSQCSRWDCTRRLPHAEASYCSIYCKILSERGSASQSPILLSDIESSRADVYCKKILACLEASKNPGVPDISANILARYPWSQPEMFGQRFFKRETRRWWIFLNPYEVDKTLWNFGTPGRVMNTKRDMLHGGVSCDGWTVTRFSVVVDGDVTKGLYLVRYVPDTDEFTFLTAEEHTLRRPLERKADFS